MDIRTLSTAQLLMDRYPLKTRDSIHVALALNQNIQTVITDDDDFDVVKEIQRKPLA